MTMIVRLTPAQFRRLEALVDNALLKRGYTTPSQEVLLLEGIGDALNNAQPETDDLSLPTEAEEDEG